MTFIINILCKVLFTKEIRRRLFKKVFEVAPLIRQAKGGSFSEVLRCFDQSFSGNILCTQFHNFLQLLQDFFFWGVAEKSVFDSKPRCLEQLKKVVKLCAINVTRVNSDQSSVKLRKKSHLLLGE